MQHINSYFLDHNLYDERTLREHCERHSVWYHTSPKFPHLVLLHYADECQFEKKWTSFSKRCRGLVVDLKNKKLLATPFFKFFNVGESEAPSYDELNKMHSFEVSEKLDGSMIILFYDQETQQYVATTKGSFDSDHGAYASTIIPEQLKDQRLLTDYTLMFELISDKFRNVVDYTKKGYSEGLYLIGVRHNMSQKLFTPKEVKAFANQFDLKTFKTYPFPNLDTIVENSKGLPFTEEGYVIRFVDSDLMVKVKGPEYLRVHRFISKLEDKNLLECLIAGQDKEILEAAPEEYRPDVEATLEGYRRKALVLRDQCFVYFNQAPKEDRKTFALWVLASVPKEYHKFLFKIMDHNSLDLIDIYRSFHKNRESSGVIMPQSPKTVLKIPDNSLVILVGVSGSGKSTFALKHFNPFSICSSDACREEIVFGGPPKDVPPADYWPQMQAVSKQAFEKMHRQLDYFLSTNTLTVADATSLRASARLGLEQLAIKNNHAPVIYLVFDFPLQLCIDRDASRRYPVGEAVVQKQFTQLQHAIGDLKKLSNATIITQENCDQLQIELVKSSMNVQSAPVPAPVVKNTIVVDLDGTLANIQHRLHFLRTEPPNWDAFYEACDKDLPKPWCVELIKSMKAAGYRVILVSARTNKVLEKTRQWLKEIGLFDLVELTLVRDGKDNTPDQILKKSWLDAFGKEQILFVVDDRQRVVDMWRENGLTCLQCDKWEERPKRPSKLASVSIQK